MGHGEIVYLTAMRTLPLLAFVFGCSTDSGSDTGDTADTDTDTDSDTDTDTDSDTDSGTTGATVTGTITLPDGSPAENFRVNVCRALCLTAKTDAAGAYTISGLAAEVASYYVLPTGPSEWGAPYAPITLVDGETQTVDVKLHEYTGTIDLTADADEHWLGMVATIVADGASYESALKEPITELTWTLTDGVGDRPPVELPDAEVLQMIWLGEFEGEGSGTMRFVNPNLPAGTRLNVWYAALPLESGWVLAGELTSADGQPMLEGEVDIPVLTAVALTVPEQ